jgi:hypothetical protein
LKKLASKPAINPQKPQLAAAARILKKEFALQILAPSAVGTADIIPT